MSGRIPLLLVTCLSLGAGGLAWWWQTASGPEYQLRHAQEALRAGDHEAGALAAASLESAGYVDQALLLRAEALLLRGEASGRPADLDAALLTLNRISAEGAGRPEAACLSARCLLRQGNVLAAERVFTSVLAQRPDDVDAHRGLMAVYYDLGALPRASHHAEKWAELAPRDGRPQRFLALAHKDLGEFREAAPYYRAALERELTDRVRQEVRLELAECLQRLGDFAEARHMLESGPPPTGLAGKYLTLRAECARGLGNSDKALALVDQALEVDPAYTPALRLRGQLALDGDDLSRAASALGRAAALAPKEFETHHLLAQVFTRQGRTGEALDEQQRVQEIQGDWKELTKLTKAAMERPKDAALHRRMAELFLKLDMPEMAAARRRVADILVPAVPAVPLP